MKIHRRTFYLPVLLASALMVACLSISPLVQVAAIKKPTLMILDRHDQYVIADASLAQEDKTPCLAQSSAMRMLLESKAEVRQAEIKPLAVAVCVRHDEYVTKDDSLDDLHRRTYLRSSEILLDVIASGQ